MMYVHYVDMMPKGNSCNVYNEYYNVNVHILSDNAMIIFHKKVMSLILMVLGDYHPEISAIFPRGPLGSSVQSPCI
jgi:hypothetical protein